MRHIVAVAVIATYRPLHAGTDIMRHTGTVADMATYKITNPFMPVLV